MTVIEDGSEVICNWTVNVPGEKTGWALLTAKDEREYTGSEHPAIGVQICLTRGLINQETADIFFVAISKYEVSPLGFYTMEMLSV